MGSQGIEMKLLASLIILLTCQALDSTGEPSADPKDVNVYVFIPKPSEGDSGQSPNVESEKANNDKKASVESEKDKIEKPVAEKKKGNDYAANFEDEEIKGKNGEEAEEAEDGEEYEVVNNIHIEGGTGRMSIHSDPSPPWQGVGGGEPYGGGWD